MWIWCACLCDSVVHVCSARLPYWIIGLPGRHDRNTPIWKQVFFTFGYAPLDNITSCILVNDGVGLCGIWMKALWIPHLLHLCVCGCENSVVRVNLFPCGLQFPWLVPQHHQRNDKRWITLDYFGLPGITL